MNAYLFVQSKLIDLSVTISQDLPATWPGHFPYIQRPWRDYKDPSEYKTNFFIMDEHCGTHFDAATHFIPHAASGERINLKNLLGSSAVIDVREYVSESKPGESSFITSHIIQDWEKRNGNLQAGEIVLFLTGWDKYYLPGVSGYAYIDGPVRDHATPGWPAPDVEAILYLYRNGIISVGIDAPSIGSVHDGIPVHKKGLSSGMNYIEGLTNLDQLPPRGALFIFLPLKIAGSTGCPGRAIALIPEPI
jgi:kynurenine formamidase